MLGAGHSSEGKPDASCIFDCMARMRGGTEGLAAACCKVDRGKLLDFMRCAVLSQMADMAVLGCCPSFVFESLG